MKESISFILQNLIKRYTNSQDEFDLYNRGIEVLEKTVDECKLLYDNIKENKLNVPMLIYNDTYR